MRNLWFSLRESWIKRQNCIGDVGTSLLQYPQFIYLLFKSKKKKGSNVAHTLLSPSKQRI